VNIKMKIINHLTLNGQKHTSEHQTLTSFKNLQKKSKKKSKQITQLALLHLAPVFKIQKIKNKRKKRKRKDEKFTELPSFIRKKLSRISAAIKTVINGSKTKKEQISQKLSTNIILSAKKTSQAFQINNQAKKKILLKKPYLFYYK